MTVQFNFNQFNNNAELIFKQIRVFEQQTGIVIPQKDMFQNALIPENMPYQVIENYLSRLSAFVNNFQNIYKQELNNITRNYNDINGIVISNFQNLYQQMYKLLYACFNNISV